MQIKTRVMGNQLNLLIMFSILILVKFPSSNGLLLISPRPKQERKAAIFHVMQS